MVTHLFGFRELARENTQRFASDVMPHLRHLWANYEDHWYPKTLTQHPPTAPAPGRQLA